MTKFTADEMDNLQEVHIIIPSYNDWLYTIEYLVYINEIEWVDSNRKRIRLSEKEIKKIKGTAYGIFGADIKIYIFESKSKPNKRGWDIDILVKSLRNISVDERLRSLARLELKGIERKVDLIMIAPETNLKDIHIEALRTGVEIWLKML